MAADPPKLPDYSNYQRLPSMVLGFHGCDEFVGEDILSGKVRHLATSVNKYDWLGEGIYFWESGATRTGDDLCLAVLDTPAALEVATWPDWVPCGEPLRYADTADVAGGTQLSDRRD